MSTLISTDLHFSTILPALHSTQQAREYLLLLEDYEHLVRSLMALFAHRRPRSFYNPDFFRQCSLDLLKLDKMKEEVIDRIASISS